MNDLKYIKNLLVEYKKILGFKKPDSEYFYADFDTIKNLEDKDKIIIQLFENIINYLEEEKLKDNGFYD